MEILKVIVDKLPTGCKNCHFCKGDGRTFPTGCEITMYIIDFGVYECSARPSWCPLVAADELTASDDGLGWIVDRE